MALIDRDALDDAAIKQRPNSIDDFRALIANTKIADAVPVVRCKDCKHWKPDGGYGTDLDGTKRLYGECDVTRFSHKESHFCSYGERKEQA